MKKLSRTQELTFVSILKNESKTNKYDTRRDTFVLYDEMFQINSILKKTLTRKVEKIKIFGGIFISKPNYGDTISKLILFSCDLQNEFIKTLQAFEIFNLSYLYLKINYSKRCYKNSKRCYNLRF